jgi:lipoprotein-releasing system permease protein
MSRLPFEAFLALRYLKPKRTFVSVITLISITGVTLGVAVLIIVISVMSGFDREWRARILGFNAHLKIYQSDPLMRVPLVNFTNLMAKVKKNPLVTGVAPFIYGQVLVSTEPAEGESQEAVPLLRGIDADAEKTVSVLATNIVAGNYDVSQHGILLGTELAARLRIHVGERLLVYSPTQLKKFKNRKKGANEEAPVGTEFTVRGVFDVQFSDYNASILVTSLEEAQELYELPDNTVQGLQVSLANPFDAEKLRAELFRDIGDTYSMIIWREEYPALFNALATEKNMMFYLLFFIMIVAAFGIINCQITFVVQKTREIGILKALGATHSQVLAIFLSQSLAVGVMGVGFGLSLALLALRYRNEFLHFMNRVAGFELLPASIYQVYELPSSLEPRDVTVICGAAFFICLAAGIFPAWKAASLQPVEALRHD